MRKQPASGQRIGFSPFVMIEGLIALLGIFLVSQPWASTYQCEDPSGVTVLTDSPAQLKNCELLSLENSPPSQPSIPQPPFSHESPGHATDPGYEETDQQPEREGEDGNEGEETETVSVPITRYGGSLVIPVRLNNKRSARLILDTGATMTVLSTNLAIELGLISSTDTEIATVNTAGGPVQVNLARIDSIQIDKARASNVPVAIHDLPDAQPGIDGLLGMSFLNHFLVTLDTDQGQLHLRPRR